MFFAAEGQVIYRQVGVIGGASLNYFRIKEQPSPFDYTDRIPVAGFQAGVFLNGQQFPKTRKILSVKIALGFETVGGKVIAKRRSFAPELEFEYTLKEIALTIYMVAQANFGKRVQYFINAGKVLGPVIAGGSVIHVVYGLTFGTGVIFPLHEKWKLILETRYNLNLTDWKKYSIDRVDRSRSFALLLGTAWRFKGRELVDKTK